MASTYLTRTPTTENINKLTLSCWVKRSSISNNSQRIFSNPSSEYLFHRFETNDQFRFTIVVDGSETTLRTNRVFRDTSAWYHIVVRWDTTQATEADRIKLWVNGVQETSFNLATYPALNSNSDMFNSGTVFEIGRYSTGNNEYFDGSMSHLHCCSGYAYDASAFGSTDSLTGIWKPKTAPSVTYGTNGFFLKFENSGAFGTDSSGNGNTFTVNGTMTQNIDTPSNVFATWNSNLAMNSTMTLANGNTTGTTGSNYASGASNCWFSTIGVSSGKWYGEFKESAGTNNQGQQIGVGYDLSKFQQGSAVNAYNVGYIAEGWGYLGSEGRVVNNNSTVITGLSTWTVGDTICIALDMDNHKLYFRKNGGSWENSGNPESGSTGTGAISLTTGETYFFGCSDASLSNTYTFQANFGNGYFGTTAVSSAQNPDDGIGIFEYDVPTGYYALNTKAINAQEYD